MRKFIVILAFLLILPIFLSVSSGLLSGTHNAPQNQEESNKEDNMIGSYYDAIEDKISKSYNSDIQGSKPEDLGNNIEDSKLKNSDDILEDSSLNEHSVDIDIEYDKPEVPKPIQRAQRNGQTDNLNILFIGADRDRLLMTAIYSINYKGKDKNFKSGSVIFSANMQVMHDGKNYVLRELFKDLGEYEYSRVMREILEELMNIHIAYHIIIDKAVLIEAERIIEPIVIDGQKINLEDIFEMPPSDKDEIILGQLMEQFTSPATFFSKLPALVFRSSRYIKTDFPLTSENLRLHFRIARNVNMDEINKVNLGKNTPEDILRDIIYQITN